MKTRPMKTRTFYALGLLVALLIAGFASFYASSQPDGLEYVAGKTGFIDTADDSAAADSPFADYDTLGVDNERLGGGIAGVVGVGVVLLAGGGLFLVLRRRGDDSAAAEEAHSTSGR